MVSVVCSHLISYRYIISSCSCKETIPITTSFKLIIGTFKYRISVACLYKQMQMYCGEEINVESATFLFSHRGNWGDPFEYCSKRLQDFLTSLYVKNKELDYHESKKKKGGEAEKKE